MGAVRIRCLRPDAGEAFQLVRLQTIMSHHDPVGTTSTGLLQGIRDHDRTAWQRIVSIYSPLVYGWTRRAGFQQADAADLTQEVMLAVLGHAARFEKRSPSDRFRAWLRTICKNKINDRYRSQKAAPDGRGGTTANAQLQEMEEVVSNPASDASDLESDLEKVRLRRRALEQAKGMFKENVWLSFWRTAVEGDHPADVAEDLGMTVWAVYKAKTRVLQRLRTELEEFI